MGHACARMWWVGGVVRLVLCLFSLSFFFLSLLALSLSLVLFASAHDQPKPALRADLYLGRTAWCQL